MAFASSTFRNASRLRRFLGPLPSLPRFTFNPFQTPQFFIPHGIEVTDRRLAPLLADLFQVGADHCLTDGDLFGDGDLRPALQVQIGHALTAFNQLKTLGSGSRHY